MTRICFILCLTALVFLMVSCDVSTGDVDARSEVDSSVVSPNLETLDTFDDIQVGFTADGYPFRGSPDAPVTIVEYSDYLCPFCGRYTNDTAPILLNDYVRTGKVRFVFRDFPIASLHPTAHIGHIAALCVGEQGAGLYWKMHDALFALQNEWSRLPDPTEFLRQIAAEIGADMGAYSRCINAGEKEAFVTKSVEDTRNLGFNSTPSFQMVSSDGEDVYPFIGAQPVDAFSGWLDALLAGNQPPVEPTPPPPEPPYWMSTEGLLPDPEHPGFTMAGDPYKGNPEADTVIIEFSDYQCPPCATHVLETQPALDEQLLAAGELFWVAKNLPLSEHASALVAATAAECASDQGKFWEMHDLLFERQNEWAESTDDAVFITIANELELDINLFTTCFSSREALERVIQDMYDAQGFIERTPTFVIIINGRATAYEGTLNPDQFIEFLNNLKTSVSS